jgi:hypothetical protein
VALLYASAYHDIELVVSISARFNMKEAPQARYDSPLLKCSDVFVLAASMRHNCKICKDKVGSFGNKSKGSNW